MEERDRIIYDYGYFAQKYLKIRDYDSPREIPFVFNDAQKIIMRAIDEDIVLRKPIRHLVLKARKEGASTFYSGLLYHRCVTRRFTEAMIVAHEVDSTIALFDKVRMFYDASP